MMVVSADSPSTPCPWWHKLHNLTCCCPSLSILLLTLSRRVLMLSCSHSPNCIFCVCVWVCCTRWPLYSSQPSHEHRYLKTVFSFSNSDTASNSNVIWLLLADHGDWDHGLVRLDGLGLSCLVGLDIKAWCLGNKQNSSKQTWTNGSCLLNNRGHQRNSYFMCGPWETVVASLFPFVWSSAGVSLLLWCDELPHRRVLL